MSTAAAAKITAPQRAYLAHFIEGPGYVAPYGVNLNTVHGAQRKGLVEKVDVTNVQLTPLGRAAMGL